MRKIILLGYMASGKSTVAQIIAQMLHLHYIDLDQYIEQKTAMTIPQLFDTRGEIYFRKVEHDAFRELLSRQGSYVIAVGGGTPCYANNHLLLNSPDVVSVYLKASIATLTERLSSGQSSRPLVSNIAPDELPEYIAKHLFDRSYFYHQARHIVSVDQKLPEIIANEIIALLA